MKTKDKKITAVILAAVLTASALTGCARKDSSEDSKKNPAQNEQQKNMEQDDSIPGEDENTAVRVKRSDVGVLARDKYEFPYMGLTASLSSSLLGKMENGGVIMLTAEEYDTDQKLSYAALQWYTLTEEQKNEEVDAFDPAAWRAGLAGIGTLGVYNAESAASLDELTGCTEHRELGKSEDGAYTYYLSYDREADEELKKELEQTEFSLIPMLEIVPSRGDSAFSEARAEVSDLGDFKTTDINGREYTTDMFKDYDLTLVNVFTTWCSPCVEEMPELQKFKEEMEAKGIGIATVVYDTVGDTGEVNQEAVDKVKILADKAGLTFPMLMPDETELNGRLKGIDGFPESFFVDKDGNIVGETYAGANTFEGWKEIAEKELANLKGAE